MDQTLPPAFDPARETNKVLAAAKTPLFKKFNWNKSQCLYDANRLAQLLVVFGKDDEALEVCQALGRIEFNGSFELWSAVEKALTLQARMERLRGNLAAADACLRRVRDAGFVEDRLNGTLLDRNGTIAESIKDGDKKSERLGRLTMAGELTFIRELGGSAVKPIAMLEQELADNLAALKSLVGIH